MSRASWYRTIAPWAWNSRTGERIYADTIISNLDKQATFNHLLADHTLASADQQKVDAFTHRGAFVHMLFKLKGLPTYSAHLDKLNGHRRCEIRRRHGAGAEATAGEL